MLIRVLRDILLPHFSFHINLRPCLTSSSLVLIRDYLLVWEPFCDWRGWEWEIFYFLSQQVLGWTLWLKTTIYYLLWKGIPWERLGHTHVATFYLAGLVFAGRFKKVSLAYSTSLCSSTWFLHLLSLGLLTAGQTQTGQTLYIVAASRSRCFKQTRPTQCAIGCQAFACITLACWCPVSQKKTYR